MEVGGGVGERLLRLSREHGRRRRRRRQRQRRDTITGLLLSRRVFVARNLLPKTTFWNDGCEARGAGGERERKRERGKSCE